MGDEDDLRLNELRQFHKTSSRLALEVHSHCEVPAGCGGVVLRWRRPGAPIGLVFSKYIAGLADEPCLDGEPLPEQRTEVTPGEHVLSFSVERPGQKGFVMLTVRLEPQIASARRTRLVSAGEGRWRASVVVPAEGWRLPGFDDAEFFDLVARDVPQPRGQKNWSWEFLRKETGGLGLPRDAATKGRRLARLLGGGTSRAWVRFSFRVDHEGFS